jgi:hypothetical protein
MKDISAAFNCGSDLVRIPYITERHLNPAKEYLLLFLSD